MLERVSYDRQRHLFLHVPQKAAVIGCGGTGTWTALFLAMSGTKEIELYDGDIVEPHNLNRLPFPPSAVGKPKVTALAELIWYVRPECIVTPNNCYVNEINIRLISSPVIFDCTDNLATQKLIAYYYPNRYRVGYNGGYNITVTRRSPAQWSTGDEPDGYEIVSSWVCSAAIAGALGVAAYEIFGNKSKETVLSVPDLFSDISSQG